MPEVAPAPPRRRSAAVRTSSGGRGIGTFARWPLDVADGYPSPARDADPWVRMVREAMEQYRHGRVEDARRLLADDVVWRIWGSAADGELNGPEAIFRYHADLGRRTDGTFRQRLLAVEGSGGPRVTAYLRTQATRGDRVLDIPSLVTFEVGRMQIRRVVEVPGDAADWHAFWSG